MPDQVYVETRLEASAFSRGRAFASAWLTILAVALGAYAWVTLRQEGSVEVQDAFGRWVYDGIVLGAAAVCLGRAALVRVERWAWLALGLGLAFWALGQTYYSIVLYDAYPAPYPSPADAGFLAFYPASYLALVLLMRARAAHVDRLAWVDGLIGALAVAAVAAALIFPPVLDALGGSSFGVAVSLAYPVADLFLLGVIVAALAVTGWRAQGTWLLIGAALVLFAACDVVYLSVSGQATEALDIASIGWPLAFLLIAGAALIRGRPVASVRQTRRNIALPIAFAVMGICVLVIGSFAGVGAAAVALGAASLVAVLARLAIVFDQNRRMLATSRHEALTDTLTALSNRRRLMIDLEARTAVAVEKEPFTVAIYDLDGFKRYNDSFGHASGDALLRRLGRGLAAAVQPPDRAYRLGGDEFCVLIEGSGNRAHRVVGAAAEALRDHGEGFVIGSSHGSVEVPREASDSSTALRIADQRMYRAKQRTRMSAGRQSTDVLLRVLQERSPELGEHLRDVSRLARAAGEQMGLDSEALERLVDAAELHDVGKLAIPDAILTKPDPLDPDEEAFLRQHSVIGERIVNAAPALSSVGRVVRGCHERFDGTGYPDGLRGEEIPLGARIIAVADAYTAMVGSPEGQRSRMTPRAALAELHREAGTRFDPDVIRAFEEGLKRQQAGQRTRGNGHLIAGV